MLANAVGRLFGIASLSSSLLAASPPAPSGPVFKASQILKPGALRGPDYSIEENVPITDNRYWFALATSFGRIGAVGIDMLDLRIREMASIQAAERMKQESPELAGIKDNVKNTGRGLKALVTDPLDALGGAAKGVGQTAKSLTKKETYQKGGSDTRRELAVQLGCDPETRNPVLKKQLDEISLRRSAGKGLMAVATFGLTGGAALAATGASALQTTAEMQDVLRTTPLYKINENMQAELVRMGVDQTTSASFVKQRQFTTLQRLQFLAQLKRLAGRVPGERRAGLPRLVSLAARSSGEPETLGLIHSLQLLADLDKQQRIAELLDAGTPAARLADGRIVTIVAVDYLMPGPDLNNWVAAIGRLRAKDAGPTILVITGQASPEAGEALAAAEIQTLAYARIDQIK